MLCFHIQEEVKNHTKRFLAGSDTREYGGFKNAPTDRRVDVATVSSPAATDVATKAAVTNVEIAEEIVGTESADMCHNFHKKNTKENHGELQSSENWM